MIRLFMRFWKKIRASSDKFYQNTPCLEYQEYRNQYGYGQFKYKGSQVPAHRFAWMDVIGAIPAGLCVCHHCDNPACVNVLHLFIGDRSANMQDMVNKGRNVSNFPEQNWSTQHPECRQGMRNGNCKLTDNQVEEIRKLYYEGATCTYLAKFFSVSLTHIIRLANCQQRK